MSKIVPLTEVEVRDRFVETVVSIVNQVTRDAEPDTRSAAQLAVFRVLVLLDGCSGAMPGFCVSPNPHPDDRADSIALGERPYPADVNIAGDLHERYSNHRGLLK